MNTRGRKKQTGTTRVPANPSAEPVPPVATVSDPVAKKHPRAKSKAPATRKSKVLSTPAKKRVPVKKRTTSRVPKTGTAIISDNESESSQIIDDPEFSGVETESEDEA